MSATAAAVVLFVALLAGLVLLMAIGLLVRRVRVLRGEMVALSTQLDPAMQRLQDDSEVMRRELASLQQAIEAGDTIG